MTVCAESDNGMTLKMGKETKIANNNNNKDTTIGVVTDMCTGP